MRRIFGSKRDQVTGEWRRLHNGKLYNLNSSTSLIWLIKSRRMRWAGDVARTGKIKNCMWCFGWEKLKGIYNLKGLGIDRRIILERMLKK